MTELENRLRKSFREKASEITPPPPPLDLQLPALDPVARQGSGGFWTPLQQRWLVPLAAAVAVLAVVAVALVTTGALTAQRKPPAAPIPASVPPYYVALDSQRPLSSIPWPVADTLPPVADATVRDTATGAIIARIMPPSPYNSFLAVSGAADDRTFILLAAGPLDRSTGVALERFYLLHIDPSAPSATGRALLTALPAGDIPRVAREAPLPDEVGSIALSPNGRMLAAILNFPVPGTAGQDNYLYVYDLTTGTKRIWMGKPCGSRRMAGPPPRSGCFLPTIGDQYGPAFNRPGLVGLSWRADGKTLAFISSGEIRTADLQRAQRLPGPAVVQLNLSARGTDIQSASNVIKVPVTEQSQAVMTPDAKTVFLHDVNFRGSAESTSLMRASAATGKATAINSLPLEQDRHATGYSNSGPVQADTILWTNYDGSELIVADARHGETAGVYSGSSYTPLQWPANIVDAAW